MTKLTNTKPQIVEHNGAPIAVVIPYDDYLKLLYPELDGPMTPHAIIKKIHLEGQSRIQAWREHLNLTQAEAAERLGVKQSSYQQLEKKTARPRKSTLEKVARAFGLDVRLLEE